MGLGSTIAGIFAPSTGSTDSSGNVYSWSQQNADFIKAQFKYGLLLNQKLAAGQITQDYYDANLWLTTQTLTPPYTGWWDEFKKAIQSEDLNWLAQQTGETVDVLVDYMGSALNATASAIGKTIGTAAGSVTSGISGGLLKGFFGSLNVYGYLAIGVIGVGIYYGFKKGLIQKAFKHEIGKLLP